jgi:formate hydrogenlyase subunit 6/NADH:ubiquinone oxidoreductase subunit I
MTEKRTSEQEIVLERAMVTRHYVMTWDLDRCVGCQIGPLVCPKEAVVHVEGEIVDGRLTESHPLISTRKSACCVACVR